LGDGCGDDPGCVVHNQLCAKGPGRVSPTLPTKSNVHAAQ
jgi:hypothetical protein